MDQTTENSRINERLTRVEIFLARIDEKLTNHVDSMRKLLEVHVDSDQKNFDSLNGRLRILERVFWAGIGSLACLEVLLKFFK